MKKTLLVLLAVFSISSFAQETNPPYSGKNEIKINAFMAVLGYPEFNYERILNEESAVGMHLGFAADDIFEQRLSFIQYYRYYFGNKPAAGFFAEGFGMLNQYEIDNSGKITDYALGFGLGAKWMTKKGFLFELSSGIGRNLFNNNKNDHFDREIVGRFGLSVGYRF